MFLHLFNQPFTGAVIVLIAATIVNDVHENQRRTEALGIFNESVEPGILLPAGRNGQ